MKRYFKKLSVALLVCFASVFVVSPLALARGGPPPHHGPHHPPPPVHHHHHHHGPSTAEIMGIIIGMNAVDYFVNRNSYYSYVPMDYDTMKSNFIGSLDDNERYLYYLIFDLDDGEYFMHYATNADARRIKKICNKLYYDFQYVGKDEDEGIVYFNKITIPH